MSKEKQRELSAKGGRASHQKGTGHEWTESEASDAGRKGGQANAARVRREKAAKITGSTEL